MRYVKSPVSTWPAYLLKNIPAELRECLAEDAAREDCSVQDVIRRLLCARYNLQCPPVSFRYEPERDRGGRTMSLKLQPKLHRALYKEANRVYGRIRMIILMELEAHYERKAA